MVYGRGTTVPVTIPEWAESLRSWAVHMSSMRWIPAASSPCAPGTGTTGAGAGGAGALGPAGVEMAAGAVAGA